MPTASQPSTKTASIEEIATTENLSINAARLILWARIQQWLPVVVHDIDLNHHEYHNSMHQTVGTHNMAIRQILRFFSPLLVVLSAKCVMNQLIFH